MVKYLFLLFIFRFVKRSLIAFAFVIFMAMITPSFALSDFSVVCIDHVDGYGKFIPRNIPYEKGENVKIYSQVSEINHNRAYAVDFLLVVYDPDNYPVFGKVIRKSGADWTDRVYVVFDFQIPSEWKTGEYKAVVYAFDVLNMSATKEAYDSFFDELMNNGRADISIVTENRSEQDYLKKEIRFNVLDDLKSTVYVFDSGLKASILPEGMNNTLELTLFNSGDEEITTYVRLFIDGQYFSKEKVNLAPLGYERVKFSIPQLDVGDHRIEVDVEWDNVVALKTLPIYIDPYMFNQSVKLARIGNGSILLSLNNYVLGSAGISGIGDEFSNLDFEREYDMNRDNSAKMITNMLAYLWKHGNYSSEMRIGLYYRSDSRAERILPDLIEYIKQLNKAPVTYVGILDDYELDKADVLFYVTDNPEMDKLDSYIKDGGNVIIDITDYYFSYELIIKNYRFSENSEILNSFYDLTSINKTVSIRLKTELKLPPEIKYSNLSVSDFIVDVGQPVKISFDIKNEGGSGFANIVVKINEMAVYNETVTLYQNEEKHIEFEYVPEKEGSYKVVLDDSDISKVFFAKNVTEVTKTPTPQGEVKEGRKDAGKITLLVGILAVLVILRFYLRR